MGVGLWQDVCTHRDVIARRQARVLITGAVGNVGVATVQQLLMRFKGVEVRAAVRDLQNAEKLAALRVPLVVMDPDRPDTVAAAMQGVDRVFLIATQDQGRAQACALLADAAVAAGVKFIAVLSIILADRTDLALASSSMRSSSMCARSTCLTALRAHMFMENTFGFAATITNRGAIYAVRPSAKFSPVSVGDIGRVAAAVLAAAQQHTNRIYHLTGPESISFGELASLFAAALSKPVRYVQVPWEAAMSAMIGMGFGEWQAQGTLELYRDIDAGGVMSSVSPDVEAITGVRGMTNAEWIATVAHVFKEKEPSAYVFFSLILFRLLLH